MLKNFRGQYKEALNTMLKGNTVTIRDFSNGSWEATKQVGRFEQLLKGTNLNVKIEGNSLRQKTFRLA